VGQKASEMPDNYLYYGNNLGILRRYIKDESVDLIYLDPPFNSNAIYNVLFAEKDGSRAAAYQTGGLTMLSRVAPCWSTTCCR
jgi:adenine specific DNA methylase Mod